MLCEGLNDQTGIVGSIVHQCNQYWLGESKNITTRRCKIISGGQENVSDELMFYTLSDDSEAILSVTIQVMS